MKRRNFLKLVAAAVVCPKELLAEKKKPWAAYHKNYNLSEIENQELVKKLREAMKNTKFRKPLDASYYVLCTGKKPKGKFV